VRRVALAAVCLLALTLAAAASARDPRAEKLQLNARDNRAARGALIAPADLSVGWTRVTSSSPDVVPSCPGYRPDFSRFTVTGKAEAHYKASSGSTVISSVEVYTSPAQAAADYRLGTKPQVPSCLASTFEQEPTGDPTVPIKAVSAKVAAAPRIGDRSARYKIVVRVTGPSGSVPLYVDAIVFQKGRTIALLMATGVARPVTDGETLARVMAARTAV
jgi:hypothetical protein